MVSVFSEKLNRLAEPPPRVLEADGWTIHEYRVVPSTNLVAAGLPPWHAVRAAIQTAGRGRFQRTWLSAEGGLWLSAVVPARNTAALPLAAGLAVCQTLTNLDMTGLRMRWPNDVLLQDRKICGLLVDRFQSSQAVIGIGVNVTNHPESADPALTRVVARVADVLAQPPNLEELTQALLANIRRIVLKMNCDGFASLVPQINELWGAPRQVELDLDGQNCRGTFSGIDEQGRLLLLSEPVSGQKRFAPHEVRHLTEL